MQAVIDAFAEYLKEITAAGALHDGDPCQPSSASFSVTVQDGHAKNTDGPMYAKPPWLSGCFVLNCKDRVEAASWAAKNPAAHVGTSTFTRSCRCSRAPADDLYRGVVW
jgi:hypothetical protein